MGDNIILFCSILDFGKGSKALKLAKKLGALGGTIFLGNGTIGNYFLNMLGVLEIRKEIFITIIDRKIEDVFYEQMSSKFNLDKAHHGIAFSVPLRSCLEIGKTKTVSNAEKKGVNDLEAIFVIVDKGLSDNVLDSAKTAGSTGGTIIHGRGTGLKETERLFEFVIEPEKEIILILSNVQKTEEIVSGINEKLNIEESNKGIIFVVDVTRSLGLYGG